MSRALLTVLLLFLSLVSMDPAEARGGDSCSSLLGTRVDDATVTSATEEMVYTIPVCRLAVTSKPKPQSDIRFELWIPKGTSWNGKFVQLGNGGLAGVILTDALRSMAAKGYAAANSDGGHRLDSLDWAADPVRWEDFSWRAQKVTTDASRKLIARVHGKTPDRTYFAGCSEGGREAMMSAQRFPEDFDGIIAAAPANYYSKLVGLYALTQRELLRPGGHLGPDDLALLQRSVLKECGGGVWLRDPLRCRFDPTSLACRPGQKEGCLTPPQVASAVAIYGGLRDSSGAVLYPGFTGGSERSGNNWVYLATETQDQQRTAAAYVSTSNVIFKYLINPGRDTDIAQLSDQELLAAVEKLAPVMDASSADLSRFRARGGKLIQWHGWADAAIPAAGSITYYEDLRSTMGEVDDFYRLYMIPGMFHCSRGPASYEVDWITVLDDWVSKGRAPQAVETSFSSGGFIQFPRKGQTLCPFPKVPDPGAKVSPAACIAQPER